MTATVEDLSRDIVARLDSIGEAVSEARIQTIVGEYLNALDDNDPAVRKIRFGTTDPRLIGSKYARYGLTQPDIEYLYDLQSSLLGKPRRNGGAHTGPSEELTRAFKAVSDAYYLSEDEIRQIDRQALDDIYPRAPRAGVTRMPDGRTNRQGRADALRASTMDSTQSGFGQQLIGAQYVGDLWDAAFQDGRIAPLINTFEMTAPTAYLPVAVDMPKMLFVAESTSDVLATAQYASIRTGSQRVQVDAKKFVIHQVWSGEMEEDSIIPFIPFMRQQAARGLSFWTDFAVLNGDTTSAGTGNINSDDGAPAATEPYMAFPGIRHAGLIDNTANANNAAGAAVSLNTLRLLRSFMRDDTRYVDFGHPNDPNDLIFVADVDTADQIGLLDEVIEARVENAANASFLNGQVGSFIGHPVVGTMALPRQDTDGKYTTTTPATNDLYGEIVAFNRNGFVIGWRRRVRIFTEIIGASDQARIVYSLRLGFGRFTPTGAASGIEASAVAYNLK